MKPIAKAQRKFSNYLTSNHPTFESIYYDGKLSGYILCSNSIDKIYFKITLNSDDTKAKITFQLAPVEFKEVILEL